MARRLETDADIDAFIEKVIIEAKHHAGQVQEVIQPLSLAVRQQIDLSRDKVEVYERNGNLARCCWVTIDGNRYAFTYNYEEGRIDLKEWSIQGQLRHFFDNSSSPDEIASVAAGL